MVRPREPCDAAVAGLAGTVGWPAPQSVGAMSAGESRRRWNNHQIRGSRHIRLARRQGEIRLARTRASPARSGSAGGDDRSRAVPSGPDRARGAPSGRGAGAGSRRGPGRSAAGSRSSGAGESVAIDLPSWERWGFGARAGKVIHGRGCPRPCDRRDHDYRPRGSAGCTDSVCGSSPPPCPAVSPRHRSW